jgi:hypothetical protein
MKYIAILIYILIISGCAVSGLSQEQEIMIYNEAELTSSTYGKSEVSILCSDLGMSMMLSPIIPLPPVIPVFFFNFDQYIHIEVSGIDVDTLLIEILLQSGKVIKFKRNNKIDNVFKFGFDDECSELDESTVILTKEFSGDVEIAKYKLKYKEGGYTLDWVYLGS